MIYKVILGRDEHYEPTLRFRRQSFRYAAFLPETFPYRNQVKWANQQFSERPWDWTCLGDLIPMRNGITDVVVYFLFNQQSDAMLFKLTWHGDVAELPHHDIHSMMGSI